MLSRVWAWQHARMLSKASSSQGSYLATHPYRWHKVRQEHIQREHSLGSPHINQNKILSIVKSNNSDWVGNIWGVCEVREYGLICNACVCYTDWHDNMVTYIEYFCSKCLLTESQKVRPCYAWRLMCKLIWKNLYLSIKSGAHKSHIRNPGTLIRSSKGALVWEAKG